MSTATITRGLAAVLVLLSALTAFGAELEISERKWIRQCVDALASDSERVQRSGGAGLTSFGIECIPVVVALSKKLTSDTSWELLGNALDGVGPAAAADAVEARRSAWPKETRERLGDLISALRDGAYSTGPLGVGGVSPPEIEKEVREILETFRGVQTYALPNLGVRRIIAMGRPAIPALVDALVREAGDERGAGNFVDSAARDALKKLCTDDDAPLLIAALERGASVAAAVLHDMRSPEVTDALLDAVTRGQVTHDVIYAIQLRASDERIPRAVARYLADANGTFVSALGPACLLVADAGYDEGLVAIRPYLTGEIGAWDRRGVAEATAILGGRDGLAMLVTFLADGADDGTTPGMEWERHRAGIALNRLTGLTFYEPLSMSGLPRELAGWRRDRLRPGDLSAAAERYSAWWQTNQEAVEYRPASRTWRVPPR